MDLYTKFGELQAEQMKVAGEPKLVVWIPNGRAQVALHWFIVPFAMYIVGEQVAMQTWLPTEATRGAAAGQQMVPEMTFPQVERHV